MLSHAGRLRVYQPSMEGGNCAPCSNLCLWINRPSPENAARVRGAGTQPRVDDEHRPA